MDTRIGPCLLALAGCVSYGKTEDDIDDPPGWSWLFAAGGHDTFFDDDDGETGWDEDFDSDADFAVDWGSSSMTLHVLGGSGVDYLGMAETGCGDPSNCWYGEDCLYGDFTGTYSYCHPTNPGGVTLDYSGGDLDITPGQETALHDGLAAAVTYYVETANNCYTWGHDTSYYAELGCVEL